ncbi:hypothetical protein [Streptomyces sp. NRRL F-6677]|uniref:hypothetical protein n=1 Tax=Streptomyces sp. NRRL F-6677 TaxID=1463879 RepID=UPI0005683E98|nr:hypothetical protein [Streptomyces sp. NRRL F-6677]
MNDISTSTQPPGTEGDEATGHGRHRGPVSAQEAETQPRGLSSARRLVGSSARRLVGSSARRLVGSSARREDLRSG